MDWPRCEEVPRTVRYPELEAGEHVHDGCDVEELPLAVQQTLRQLQLSRRVRQAET